MELFPAIDLHDGGAVRLVQGDFGRVRGYGDPAALARSYVAGGARWIHVVDLDAARTGEPVNRDVVLEIAAAVDVEVQAGGGVRGTADAAALLDHGVRRVVLGTAALETPELVESLAERYPGRVAVGLDHRGAELAVRGWERPSGVTLRAALGRLAPVELGAVVVTAIDRDGMLGGPDLVGLRTVLDLSAHPVVASGGVRSPADLRALAALESPASGGRGLAGADCRDRAGRGCHDRRGGDRRMRAVRVIPCLDVDAGRVVKGVRFVDLVDAGDPVALAARYDAEGADELVFLDITASAHERDTMVDVVSRTAAEVFIPFTVGGGVRAPDDARRLLRAGADKVALNTAAILNPELIAELADEFGSQCVVVAVDARAAHRSRAGGLHPRGTQGDGQGRRGVGGAVRGLGGGGDPRDVDGPRRHAAGLRRGAHPRHRRHGRSARGGLGWGGQSRAPRAREPRREAPTPCWRRRSSTGASTPWPRPRRTSPRTG